MERVRCLLVGCGGMGRRHLRGLAKLRASSFDNLELVAVCDLDRDNARLVADEAEALLGQRPRVYQELARAVGELDGLEAAIVTTDTGSHHVVATACLELGLHVLCEKSLAVTLRGCNRVIEAARRTGRVLSVAENYRRDPINRLARALIQDGAIGEPRLMLETSVGGRDAIAITPWRHLKHAGAITLDAGVHHADILRFYLGAVRSVYGETRLHERVRCNTRSAGPGGFYARWSERFPDRIEPTGEDALYAHVTFASGAVAHWVFDQAGHGKPTFVRHVYGSRGSLECPGDRNGRPIVLHRDDGTAIADERILDEAPSYRLDPLAAELFGGERVWTYRFDFNETDARIMALEQYELGECVRTGARPEVDGEEARADVALTYAPFDAGRLGRPVTLVELVAGAVDAYQREIDAQLGLL